MNKEHFEKLMTNNKETLRDESIRQTYQVKSALLHAVKLKNTAIGRLDPRKYEQYSDMETTAESVYDKLENESFRLCDEN